MYEALHTVHRCIQIDLWLWYLQAFPKANAERNWYMMVNAISIRPSFFATSLTVYISFTRYFCLLPTESPISAMVFTWCGLCWRTLVQMFSPALHWVFIHALNTQRSSNVKHVFVSMQNTLNRKSLNLHVLSEEKGPTTKTEAGLIEHACLLNSLCNLLLLRG